MSKTSLDEILKEVREASWSMGLQNAPLEQLHNPHNNKRATDKAKQAIIDWHEIEKSEVYNSGCADTAKHILALFDNQIPEQLKQWLRLEIEDRGKL